MWNKIIFILFCSVFAISCTKDETEVVLELGTKEPIVNNPAPTPIVENPETSLANAENWLLKMQSSNGLLASSENTDSVSLYDNALAAHVFIQINELERAERIFDFFNDKVNSELLNERGGFYQFRNIDGQNGNRTWLGDNAWLLIALNKYHSITGNDKYQNMAHELEQWLRNLQDTDGGLWGGLNEDGTVIPKITEGIITAFCAVKGYDDFHKNILSFLKWNRWDEENEILVAWPENPAYNYALDLHTLGSLIFSDYATQSLAQADRFYTTQISTIHGVAISGYCFDEDKDVVWLEGTAQMAVAQYFAGNLNEHETIISELEKSVINSASLSNSFGLPYTSNHGSNYGSGNLWDHADLTPSISATAWYIFAKGGFNPLNLYGTREIPIIDSFWGAQSGTD